MIPFPFYFTIANEKKNLINILKGPKQNVSSIYWKFYIDPLAYSVSRLNTLFVVYVIFKGFSHHFLPTELSFLASVSLCYDSTRLTQFIACSPNNSNFFSFDSGLQSITNRCDTLPICFILFCLRVLSYFVFFFVLEKMLIFLSSVGCSLKIYVHIGRGTRQRRRRDTWIKGAHKPR